MKLALTLALNYYPKTRSRPPALAMDAGFRSLSSFNKAFKATHGVTPTAWRKQALDDAA